MSLPTRAIRWGGLAAMLAGVAVLAQIMEALLLTPPGLGALSPLSPYRCLYLALLSASWLFTLGGLVSVHILQKDVYGRLGSAGFFVAFAGALAQSVTPWLTLLLDLTNLNLRPLSGTIFLTLFSAFFNVLPLIALVGLTLIGSATLRARVLIFPWSALPLIIALLGIFSEYLPWVVVLVSLPLKLLLDLVHAGVPQVLVGLGWVLLGYALWSGRESVRRRPAAAR